MKRKLFILFCLIIMLVPMIASCGGGNNGDNPEKLSAEEIYERVSPSVVVITAESPSSTSSGTGFFYKNGSTVVTNYHVIKDCSTASITLTNGNEYDVLNVLGYDKEKDIAILEVDYKKGTPLDIRNNDVKTGETVYAIGNSLGFLEGSLSEGIVSTAKRDVDGQIYIQTTASVTHGNSGGPLIDSYGKVIGIVSAGFGDGLDLNLAIPISRVDTISTSNPSKLDEIINVEWISNRQVWHQDENDRYVLVFTLADANKNPVAVPGWISITIRNDYNEVVYEKLHKFGVNDYQYWYYDNYTVEKYQATVYINDSEIQSNYCSTGTLTFVVSGNDYSFDAYSLDVEGLPQKSINNGTVDEKTVYTAQEFVDSINHNRKIILGSKYYDFTNVDISSNALLQKQTYGEGFVINGVYNLSIEGNADLVIDDLSSVVLSFNECSKLSLNGLTIGHIEPPENYSCEAAVVSFDACNDVKISGCKLFGCGSIGIEAADTTGIVVKNTEIYDCTYTGVGLQNSSASFEGCKIYDLPSADSVIWSDNSTIKLSNCEITGTDVTVNGWRETFIFSPDYNGSSNITFDNCAISNNKFSSIALTSATNITFKNCTFRNNSTIKLQNGVTYTNCTWDNPPTQSVRDTVVKWVKENYLKYENNCMTYSAYSDDDSTFYAIEYDVSDDHLYMGVEWTFENGDSMFLMLSLDGNGSKYSYTAVYNSGSYQNQTTGILDGTSFNENNQLTYLTYTGDYWNKEVLMNLYRAGYIEMLDFFNWCLEYNSIGVTIEDFGFEAIEFNT